VVIVIGANPAVNHPVAATWIKNAVRRARLIVMDPRRGDLARHATHAHLQFKPDTDVALLNAMMHVIVEEGLVDERTSSPRTEGYEALAANVRAFSPRRWRRSPASMRPRSARWRGPVCDAARR
jgi:formate dehydrogenase major subunit